MKVNRDGSHIRYLGFETPASGGRRLQYAITAPEQPSRHVSIDIPVEAFSGSRRITFQDGAAVGYEKIRSVLDSGEGDSLEAGVVLSLEDIERFRPRRRAAARRT